MAKLIYGYIAFTYSKSIFSVILWAYLFRVLYVLIYHIDHGLHPQWFDGLGNFDYSTYYQQQQQQSETTTTTTSISMEPSLFSVVVVDFIWGMMGILIAKLQDFCIYKRMLFELFNDAPYFMSSSEWKIKKGPGYGTRFFWFYLVQTLLLGTPATAVFTIHYDHSVRSGIIVYYLIQISLWTCFYAWNRYLYQSYLNQELMIKNHSWTIFSKFDATYLCWFLTISIFSIPCMFNTSFSHNIAKLITFLWTGIVGLWSIIILSYFIYDHLEGLSFEKKKEVDVDVDDVVDVEQREQFGKLK